MRYVYLLLIGIIFCMQTDAQTTYRYRFGGGLHEVASKGPVLKAVCAGAFKWESLPAGVTKGVYRFEKGCGLEYDDNVKNLLSSGSYTIELYFKLDTITGYKKVIDYDSLSKDAGFYNQGGKLVLYSTFTSADSFLGDDKYMYIVVTRNGTTKDMYVYANNKVAGMMNDATDQYKYGTDKKLFFFRDDNGTSGEHTGGSVAAINISDYVMDSATVKSNFGNLASRVGIDEVEETKTLNVYPNPVAEVLNIDAAHDMHCTVTDIAGRVLMNFEVVRGANNIAVNNMPAGMYLLTATADGGEQRVYKIVKQ